MRRQHVLLEILDLKFSVLINHIRGRIVFLGQGDRAGVEVGQTVAEGGGGEHVGVSVNEDVAVGKKRRRRGVIVVSVGDEETPSFLENQQIIGENG